ncbi:MAG: trigger factor, partial [Muribaculaceae bacterium]|nr:trigger factor [Muribaculaceae bacterium]
AEITDEEKYFAELKKMIAAQLEPNSDFLFHRDAREALVEKFGNFNLPAEFLKKWLVASNEELTPEKAAQEFDAMIPSIKWELISGRLAAALDIKVEQNDMLEFAKGIAYQQFMQYGMTNMDDATLTDYAKRILSDKNYAQRIHQDVFERKLFNAVRSLANVEEKSVSLDEFKAIVNPQAAAAE